MKDAKFPRREGQDNTPWVGLVNSSNEIGIEFPTLHPQPLLLSRRLQDTAMRDCEHQASGCRPFSPGHRGFAGSPRHRSPGAVPVLARLRDCPVAANLRARLAHVEREWKRMKPNVAGVPTTAIHSLTPKGCVASARPTSHAIRIRPGHGEGPWGCADFAPHLLHRAPDAAAAYRAVR